MAPTLGFTALLMIIFLNFAAPFLLYRQKFAIYLKAVAFATFFTALTAQICLIYSFVISDFSVLNVYQNSHQLKPLIYKISGAWGNHEGSMLLLLLILSFYSLVFAIFNKSEFKNIALCVQNIVIGGFAIFTAFASNPFELIFPVPRNGLGLNPLLQDIGLAIHPPMLYVGYIGFFVTFALALAGLLKEKVNSNLAKNIEPWLFFSWGFLTLGIGLGSWWAYRELGWGGYWFWDPVENVSLMPWLAATALIHCVMVLRRDNSFGVWSVLLSILTFILCLLGIFLVRSGLLTSVHSFAVDAKRGFFIILLIASIGGAALFIFGVKVVKIIQPKIRDSRFLSYKIMALLNNYFLMIVLFTIVLGIFYPILAQNIFSSSISIGASYYNKIFGILLVPFLVFMAISYCKKWPFSNSFRKKFLITFGFSILITIAVGFFMEQDGIFEILLLFLAVNVFLLAALSKKNVANIAHLGFAMILMGVILSSILGSDKEINIKQGEKISITKNYEAKFHDVNYLAGSNFVARQVIFDILRNGEKITQLKPQLRYYPIADQTTFEASIDHGIFGDLYLAVGNKDEQENYALRIYVRPFIYLIWLGCLMIFLAGMVRVFQITSKPISKAT